MSTPVQAETPGTRNACPGVKGKPPKDRLYDIRNPFNHGDIDASDPNELIRVEDRHRRLWMIVFGMLGLFIPIKRPLDSGPS